eukprot:CAMPEP_0172410960 /NCGR_PEP_ID=MMETSP1061-20121228/77152_1 /TAXON_ID=37318 /ORGANISM="Pseudo-nitzschia pungens, Strain cf. pungens" /LENGTH=228 /DNA_ID=CAMNT_0013147165 /DNA_START=183 /DNA_END=869 /DNA_ORIENTATION=-
MINQRGFDVTNIEKATSTKRNEKKKKKKNQKKKDNNSSSKSTSSTSHCAPQSISSPKKDRKKRKHKKKKIDKKETATIANAMKAVPNDRPSPVTKPETIAEFLVSSSHHYDKKNAVVEWITTNPSSAAILTPTDVGSTISKISFALEHPETAKLLAEGIHRHGGSVTTAHILAAMKESPIQDALVAEAMIPYVVDLQNKEKVLDALHMSFSADEVAKCFAARETACGL